MGFPARPGECSPSWRCCCSLSIHPCEPPPQGGILQCMGADSGSRRRAPVATGCGRFLARPARPRRQRSPYLRLVGRDPLHRRRFHPPPHSVKPIPAGPDHGTPQLVEPTPSCLVAAQAEHLLKPQRTPSGFLAGQVPHGLKPHSQGLLRPFKKSSPPSERFGADTFYTSGGPFVSQASLPTHSGIGSSAATEPAADTPDTPLPSRTNRRTPAGFWDSQRRQ